MINTELMETARLLVAAVQDSDNFTADYLRRLILRFVPMLLGEIEILADLASRSAQDAFAGGPVIDAVEEPALPPLPAAKKQRKRKGKRR